MEWGGAGCVCPEHRALVTPRHGARESDSLQVLAAGAEAIGMVAGGLSRGDGQMCATPGRASPQSFSRRDRRTNLAPCGEGSPPAQTRCLFKSQESENLNFINYYKEFNLYPQISFCLKLSDVGFAVICNLRQCIKK